MTLVNGSNLHLAAQNPTLWSILKTLYSVFGKILSPVLDLLLIAIGQILLAVNGQVLNKPLGIWSH